MTDEISIKEPMCLTHQNVEEVFKDCLANTTEYTLKGVCIEVAFNREKIAEHEQDIMQMLMQLPIQFHRPGGCGWSFLNMCIDRDGNQWTDYHQTQDNSLNLSDVCEPISANTSRTGENQTCSKAKYLKAKWTKK